jgi:hypothetical protein
VAESDNSIIIFLASFMAIGALVNSFLPAPMQFLNPWGLATMVVSILTIGAVCVVATGIPCAVGLATFGILANLSGFLVWLGSVSGITFSSTITDYFTISSISWVNALLSVLSLVFIFILAKLARGVR